MKNRGLAFSILLLYFFVSCQTSKPKLVKFQGETQGTYYAVTYYDPEGRNFRQEVDSLLDRIDQSVSIWRENSIISRINRNEDEALPDSIFIDLYGESLKIYERSGNAFDPTIGPLVNAWGFGFTSRMKVTQAVVDSLMPLVGFNKVFFEDGRIRKQDPRVQFDFNGIAQGYSVDRIGKFLEKMGIGNYLVDIGGEILARGTKPGNQPWTVGIEKPSDTASYGRELKAIVRLENKALATSGNYRKFYILDGIRYSHTIDPATGYPVQHSILSVSVLADNATLADGWATAFMVLGLEQSIEILARDKSLEAYFIYSGVTSGDYKTYFTEGFKEIIVEEMD